MLEKFTLLILNKALCYGVFPSVWVVYLRFVANKDISSYIGEKFPINQFSRRHVMSTCSMLASCSLTLTRGDISWYRCIVSIFSLCLAGPKIPSLVHTAHFGFRFNFYILYADLASQFLFLHVTKSFPFVFWRIPFSQLPYHEY